jgi:FAD/FMN-containing dehydrogenase
MGVREETDMLEALRSTLRGQVIDPSHADYDDARRVWNGLIDRHPAVIARCADTSDVVEAVAVARRHRPVVSIRGGGHQVAGSAVAEDGLVIDLSGMKGIHVDPAKRTARAQAGVRWGELDRETQLFGLAAPGGEVSVTGIAGLTLGGGLGVAMRELGLSCDALRSIEIVTADGMVRTASANEHPDLFWAARGGGRGLGVVTSFEFALRPLGPEVETLTAIYAYVDAANVLRAFCDAAPSFPDTVTPEAMFITLPPVPDFPEELHGQRVFIVSGVYAGPVEDGGAALAPLKDLGTPLGDMAGPVPYVELQSAFDGLLPEGERYYMKSHFMDELTDDAISALIDVDGETHEGVEMLTVVRTMGGAISRVRPDDSAFAHRSATFNLSLDTHWTDPAVDQDGVSWARRAWDATQPFSTGGVYVNFSGLDDDTAGLRSAILGSSERRLNEVRGNYDPDGLFESAAYRA